MQINFDEIWQAVVDANIILALIDVMGRADSNALSVQFFALLFVYSCCYCWCGGGCVFGRRWSMLT